MPGLLKAATSNDDALVHNAKQIALLALGLAHQKHGPDLEKQQEVVMNISDCLLEAFAMESTWLRSLKMGRQRQRRTLPPISAPCFCVTRLPALNLPHAP